MKVHKFSKLAEAFDYATMEHQHQVRKRVLIAGNLMPDIEFRGLLEFLNDELCTTIQVIL